MEKLLELEKRLKLAQIELNKIMSAGTTQTGSVNSTGGASIASQIGFGKAEDDKKKKKHEDEKEDKEMIAEALDEHNEKKHSEPKDEDSAKKDLKKGKLPFDANKLADKLSSKPQDAAPRLDAVEIDPATGGRKTISADEQVKMKAQASAGKKANADAKRAKFEEEAKARRAEHRKQGLIKFDKNGQWSMDKDS